MTIKMAKQILAAANMTLHVNGGEYRVNFAKGNENTAYYTDDLADAVATGLKMVDNRGVS